MSISPYTYKGLLYCKECGKDICDIRFTKYAYAPEDVSNYSSWDFPKPHHASKADFPWHCAKGASCSNAIKLSSGRKIGAWLGNELTDQGIEFVLQEIHAKEERAEIWANLYSFTLSQYMIKKLGKVLGYEKKDRTLDFPFLDDLKAENNNLKAENVTLRNALVTAGKYQQKLEAENFHLRKQQQHLEAEISCLKKQQQYLEAKIFRLENCLGVGW